MADLPDAATIAKVLSLLASLGVSDALLQQVKSSIPPPKQLQIIAGKIAVLEQQVGKLQKTKERLIRGLGECHVSRADKESQLEMLRAQYREVRDTGKFTPTRTSPAPSVRALSVDGDESLSRDGNMGDVNVGAGVGSSVGPGEGHAAGNANPGAGDAQGLGQVDAQERLDGVPSSSRPVQVDFGKRRCVEAPGAPSVEAVSSGRWHSSAEQRRDLEVGRASEHLYDTLGFEGGLDSEVSLG